MLISEIIKSKKSVFQLDHSVLSKNKLLGNENSFDSKFAEDDEEEKFVDVKSESEEEKDDVSEKDENEEEDDDERTNGSKNCTNKMDASWIHKKNIVFKRHDRYDYQERNPLYCGADKTLTYELLPLTRHYHPTVVVFANKLMNEEPVDYTGDPMEDFTLVHFLDRFVYKNPKKSKSKDQPSKELSYYIVLN
jgi:ribosome biogenesis protein MAK21